MKKSKGVKIHPSQINPHLRKDLQDHLPMFAMEYIKDEDTQRDRRDKMVAAYEEDRYKQYARIETGIKGLYIHRLLNNGDKYE